MVEKGEIRKKKRGFERGMKGLKRKKKEKKRKGKKREEKTNQGWFDRGQPQQRTTTKPNHTSSSLETQKQPRKKPKQKSRSRNVPITLLTEGRDRKSCKILSFQREMYGFFI